MELSKQGQPPVSTSMGSQPLPSPNIQSSQAEYPSMFYPQLPVNWGAQPMLSAGAPIPISSYYIIPVSGESVQMDKSRPEASHLMGAQPLSRVSLRPPQQVLNVQTSMPAMIGSQHSPSMASKKQQPTAASPRVQMLKSGPPQSSNKRSAQKETPVKVQPELFESVRSKMRESLAAALSMDSDQQNKQESAQQLPLAEYRNEQSHGEGTSLQDKMSTTKLKPVPNVDAKKCGEDKKLTGERASGDVTGINNDLQQQPKPVSSEEVPSHGMVVADELLQGHGLCWASDTDAGIGGSVTQADLKRVRTSDIDAGVTESLTEPDLKKIKMADVATEDKKWIVQKAENLAFRIEAELFKLFGGVNKKYKEKGRSLMFNLKDRSNPELRERVLSGDIAPDRLCSMTAEELASKELSQWRLAKAEEFQHMVVLPDTDADVRRLVKKTHKGEFQVEMEQTDGVSVEVELGGNMLSKVPSKANKGQVKSKDKTSTGDKTSSGERTTVQREVKAPEGILQDGVEGAGDNNSPGNLEDLLNERTDLMQELMVDDMKDTEHLPPIVSLDEFMEALDSEPPFENLSVETLQDNPDPSSIDKAEADTMLESENFSGTEDKVPASEAGSKSDLHSSQDNSKSKSESPKDGPDYNLDHAAPSKGDPLIKSSPDKGDAKRKDADNSLKPDLSMMTLSDASLTHESIWEGAIQLTVSSITNVYAVFKSGEKPSTKEWPSFVEIKGRVKLAAFEEFLEQLPKSRSRAMMITELRWKDGSPEIGRHNLLQTIDSYVSDERVGVAVPLEGVELYLCPPQGKSVEILARLAPKEHLESLTVAGVAVIGVVVWRRPYVSSRAPSHHRHSGGKRQSSSRKPQAVNSNPDPRSSTPLNSYGPSPPGFPHQRHHLEDDVTDDVPPGFGPGVAARDDDDLPEFDFVNASNSAAHVTSQAYKGRQDVLTSARPVEQMRELVHKYGKRSSIQAQSWNDDDDDDIPEWNPNQNVPQQMPLPPPPPPPKQPLPPLPPVQPMQSYQQLPPPPPRPQYNPMQPLQMASNHLSSQSQLQHQQFAQQLPSMHQQQAVQPGWQPNHPNAWWPASGASAEAAAPAPGMMQQSQFGVMPNNSGQVYGMGNLGGMPWRRQ